MRFRPCLACTGLLLLLLPAASSSDPAPTRGATTPLGDPLECTVDARDQVTTTPPVIILPPAVIPRSPCRLDGYVPTDSIEASLIVTARDEYCVRFDSEQLSLEAAILPYTLTEAARTAIAHAPAWLRMDLENNFRRLSAVAQDRYAALLEGVTDPRLLDEVAFQVAHLSYSILYDPNWDEQLIVTNAALMYQIDPELAYVEIVDYDLGGGDFYSTTRYRTIVAGDTTQVEIPREMYYWWIVMPKLSDEKPLMDGTVYNTFWREYLFYEHDAGYPLLQDVMRPITVLWDGLRHDWPGGRPFTDTMLAVDVVGNWCSETVPLPASGNRPIQPNQIAHEHNGNCGELQDLLCAAARTCLIPTVCTMDILEDHVWCETWLDAWHPYQVDLGGGTTHIANPGIAYDVDHGGGKDDSCIWDWRNDGFTWDAIATYSQTCTLTVAIADPGGVPVDNAHVLIASEFYYAPYDLYYGTWGETGQDGTIRFILGDNQNYYVRVISSLGVYPLTGYALIISSSVAGEHYYWNWTTNNSMTQLAMTEDPPGSEAPFVIEVEYDLPYDIQSGHDYWTSPFDYYSEKLTGGHLDFFIANQENMDAYLAGTPFHGYHVAEGASGNLVTFHPPVLEDYYVVLSGAEHLGLATLANVKVRLWQDATGVATAPALASLLPPAPNPFNPRTTLSFSVAEAGPVSLLVYDTRGALLRRLVDGTMAPGFYERAWDGRDDAGRLMATGVYLARLQTGRTAQSRKLVLLK
jgi:hypothetical protein